MKFRFSRIQTKPRWLWPNVFLDLRWTSWQTIFSHNFRTSCRSARIFETTPFSVGIFCLCISVTIFSMLFKDWPGPAISLISLLLRLISCFLRYSWCRSCTLAKWSDELLLSANTSIFLTQILLLSLVIPNSAEDPVVKSSLITLIREGANPEFLMVFHKTFAVSWLWAGSKALLPFLIEHFCLWRLIPSIVSFSSRHWIENFKFWSLSLKTMWFRHSCFGNKKLWAPLVHGNSWAEKKLADSQITDSSVKGSNTLAKMISC